MKEVESIGGVAIRYFPEKARKLLHVGERKLMNCGMHAEIVEYFNSRDITIKFEDGTIRELVQYSHFKKGDVRHPYMRKRRRNTRGRPGRT